jgi:transmembrane sensor
MTDALIEKFFDNRCTASESEEVTKYLKENPAILDKYLNVTEWTAIVPQHMPEKFWAENWDEMLKAEASLRSTKQINASSDPIATTPVHIHSRINRAVVITWIKRTAVAAVLIVSAGLAYRISFIKDKPDNAIAAKAPVIKTERKITVNNSDQLMNIMLPDSSDVILSPGSLITYYVPFTNNKRDLTLDGEGRFKVMKNEFKPFTVYAGGLATTALGTEFTINTKKNIIVKLHTGRVMITAVGERLKYWKKNVMLEPGQQLNYDIKEMTASVTRINTQHKIAGGVTVKKPGKIVPDELPVMNFVNTSLPDVMNKLTACYHQNITFDSTELNDINFTGTISKNDSLPIVLKVIAQMNDLDLIHNDNGYEIKKIKK